MLIQEKIKGAKMKNFQKLSVGATENLIIALSMAKELVFYLTVQSNQKLKT